jgi:NAD(P)-dependent dehydrogenase (short-subunit alcohol dehydrogenase family)
VLVTGATGGLGPSIVEAALALGGSVVAVGRRKTRADELRAEMRHHERLSVAECDVTDPAGLGALFAAVGRRGALDAVVHAVGAFRYGALRDASDADLTQLIDANVRSTLLVVREACRALPPSGSIVVVGADRPEAAMMAAYGATKSVISHLVGALALELGAGGPRINAVLPGTLDTHENRAAMPEADPSRWASPKAVARAVVWLIGPDAGGISGSLVRIPS